MSLAERKQCLEDISKTIERHKSLYKLVEFKSVVARRCKRDTPNKEDQWHNFITLIKMLHSGTLRPWEKQVEKDNFAILQAAITIDSFKEVLERLVDEQVLEVNGYQLIGPFNFLQREFLGSKQSETLYNTDCAVNFWQAIGKTDLGLPNSRSLELESETVPFKNARDAIEYHTGLTHEGFDNLRNSIHIVAPLYYAKIARVELSGSDLLVKIDHKMSSLQDLRIKYNTEGLDDRTTYYVTLEAGTVEPKENTTKIHLKQEAEMATVWLHHTKGYPVDFHKARRTPSIETIERKLSSGHEELSEEDARVIIETIHLRSSVEIPSLVTTELGVDSIDIEILKAVKNIGGDCADFFPDVLKYLSIDMLLSRLARLRTLGFLTLQPPRKILLTSIGVDALNLPPGILQAKVPPDVGKRLAEINLAFRNENYDEVTNKSTKLIESILRKRLEDKFSESLQDVWAELNAGPYNRASLGILKDSCLRLKVFKKNGLTDHTLSSILKLRVPMAHEKEGSASPSNIALLTLQLVKTFVRTWYYLELDDLRPA